MPIINKIEQIAIVCQILLYLEGLIFPSNNEILNFLVNFFLPILYLIKVNFPNLARANIHEDLARNMARANVNEGNVSNENARERNAPEGNVSNENARERNAPEENVSNENASGANISEANILGGNIDQISLNCVEDENRRNEKETFSQKDIYKEYKEKK